MAALIPHLYHNTFHSISTDQPSKVYQSVLSSQSILMIGQFVLTGAGGNWAMNQTGHFLMLCLDSHRKQVRFMPSGFTCPAPVKEELKGLVLDKKFFLFGKDSVLMFNETAFDLVNQWMPVEVRKYSDWIDCDTFGNGNSNAFCLKSNLFL